jgi:transcriptional regulator of arginine metabolism
MRAGRIGVNFFFAIIRRTDGIGMKKLRQKTRLDLVRSRDIASQEELLENLVARKIEVSQSTLSRDIQELGLAKSGGVYTVIESEPVKTSDDTTVRRLLREFLLDVAVAQNLVVLKSGPGNASVISQAVDDAGWPEIVGSIAGENTVFVAVRNPKEAREIADRILAYLQ